MGFGEGLALSAASLDHQHLVGLQTRQREPSPAAMDYTEHTDLIWFFDLCEPCDPWLEIVIRVFRVIRGGSTLSAVP